MALAPVFNLIITEASVVFPVSQRVKIFLPSRYRILGLLQNMNGLYRCDELVDVELGVSFAKNITGLDMTSILMISVR